MRIKVEKNCRECIHWDSNPKTRGCKRDYNPEDRKILKDHFDPIENAENCSNFESKTITKLNEKIGEVVDELFNKEEKIKVSSPIVFVNEKLYYIVPLGKKILKNEDDTGNYKKKKRKKKEIESEKENLHTSQENVVHFLGVLGSSHSITIYPPIEFYSEEVSHPNLYNGYFSHLDFEIEDVKFIFHKDQDVILRKLIKEAISNDGLVCKSNLEEIFSLVKILEYYVKYDNKTTPYVIASWILGTYLFPMFNYYPYLYFRAEKGAGKGTNLLIISKTAWNPTDKIIATTEAPLFRMIQRAKPTLILDEYHRILQNKYQRGAIESILEAGSEKGGRVPRCKENNPDEIEFFDVYCPKVIASRISTEIEEKAIVIILPKISDLIYAERRKELDNDPRFEKIREGLLRIALSKWQEIYEFYKSIKPSKHLTGRDFQFWAPILAIAKVIFPDKFSEILKFAEESAKRRFGERFEIEDQVLTALYNNLGKITGKPITFKDLREWTDGLHHNTIKSALGNLKLIKSSRAGKIYLFEDRLKKLLEERGYFDISEDFNSEKGEKPEDIYWSEKDELDEELDKIALSEELEADEKKSIGEKIEEIEENYIKIKIIKMPPVDPELNYFEIAGVDGKTYKIEKEGQILILPEINARPLLDRCYAMILRES